MPYLEVIARAAVRPGQFDGFTEQAAKIIRLTAEQDTRTLRCDWFVDDDDTRCEVHELFWDEQGLLEHKMHTMEPTTRLFREYASGHQSTIFGEVSSSLTGIVRARTGAAPHVFAFLEGLDPDGPGAIRSGPAQAWNLRGESLEVHAHMRVRPGQLAGFTAQAAELVEITREQDTKTSRYDWFLDEDRCVCEVHEAYTSGQGLFEHNMHIMGARANLFERYADGHRMTAFGHVSQELRELGRKHAGGLAVYSLLQGLGTPARV
jgi:quinol monooxygenase YgiN